MYLAVCLQIRLGGSLAGPQAHGQGGVRFRTDRQIGGTTAEFHKTSTEAQAHTHTITITFTICTYILRLCSLSIYSFIYPHIYMDLFTQNTFLYTFINNDLVTCR